MVLYVCVYDVVQSMSMVLQQHMRLWCCSMYVINFLEMKYTRDNKRVNEDGDVRRLGTVTDSNPNYLYTTQWLWYWKDESGRFAKYGQVFCVSRSSFQCVYYMDALITLPCK